MKLNRDTLQKLPRAFRIQVEENAQRKALTQSELAVEQKHILAELRKHRTPGARTDLQPVGNLAHRSEAHATETVAKLFGEGRKTMEKRLAICDAAEAEPEKYGKLRDDMDRTGRVNGVFRRLKIAGQAEQILAEPPPLPGRAPYRVIVADPPWPYDRNAEDPSSMGVCKYPPMPIADICALSVASIVHEDCVLWLWTTNAFMRRAYEVLDAWGFQEKTILTWAKDRPSTGNWLWGQTEHAIMAVRGKPVVTLRNQTTLFHAPRRGHSAKPVEFYDLVESLCPAPRYADIFSRYRHNEKWIATVTRRRGARCSPIARKRRLTDEYRKEDS
jgi:N6-adenosine-specific RNA methylase IME4